MNKNSPHVYMAMFLAALFGAAPLYAVSTRHFALDTAEAFDAGELKHAIAHSNGRISPGVPLSRIDLGDVPVAYSFAKASDGTLFVGTGDSGKIFRLAGSKMVPFAETKQTLVTSLVFGMGGKLFAGTLPEGRIFVIEPSGKVVPFAQPKGVKHIWDLAYDAKRQMLFAATGPQGQVFGIKANGTAKVFLDTSMTHVMRLSIDKGVLYAGTSDEAILYRILGPNQSEVVYDFPGDEITGLSARNGMLGVAINEFVQKSEMSKDAKKIADAKRKDAQTKPAIALKKPGKGQLWVIHSEGWAEQQLVERDLNFTSVQIDVDGALYAGTGVEGKIIRVSPDGQSATWIDVDERQVLAFDVLGKDPVLLTGDAAAVYRLGRGVAKDAMWTSEVLDAEFHSRWGQLTWRGRGKLGFETRSGNTERPDATWTDWSSTLTSSGPIRSPASRFLQLRAKFGIDPGSMIRAVQVYYLPQNHRARVTDIAVKPSPTEESSSKPEDAASAMSVRHSSVLHLQWKVDNPDGDALRYRVGFRPEGQSIWRDVLEPAERLLRPEYKWETAAIKDGYYRIRIEASDEPDNPMSRALVSAKESSPILVDNHAPVITKLKLRKKRLTGVVTDSIGPIESLYFAIDGAPWEACYPADDLLDTASERIDLALPTLEHGPHVVAVRASDAAGNITSSELAFTAH